MKVVGHDYSVSVIRVLAMMMIVMYHCLCYNAGVWGMNQVDLYSQEITAIIKNISTVGLNAFVLISGLLYFRFNEAGRYGDTSSFLRRKFKRLLMPYLIMGTVICCAFSQKYGFTDLLYGISHLWFLLMLFEIFIFAAITKCLWMRLKTLGCIFVCVILLLLNAIFVKYIYPGYSINGKFILAIQFTSSYLPMFYLGMITEKYKVYNKIAFHRIIRLIIAIAAFAGGACLIYTPVHGVMFIQWIPPYLLFLMFYRGGQYGRCMDSNNTKCRKALLFFDRYSMPVYIIHHILIFALLLYAPITRDFLGNHIVLSPVCLFFIITPVSLSLSYFLSFIPGSEYCLGVSNRKKK